MSSFYIRFLHITKRLVLSSSLNQYRVPYIIDILRLSLHNISAYSNETTYENGIAPSRQTILKYGEKLNEFNSITDAESYYFE